MYIVYLKLIAFQKKVIRTEGFFFMHCTAKIIIKQKFAGLIKNIARRALPTINYDYYTDLHPTIGIGFLMAAYDTVIRIYVQLQTKGRKLYLQSRASVIL